MTDQNLILLNQKQYDKVILPYIDFVQDDKHLASVHSSSREFLEYMLANDPDSEYTLLAADNLFKISLDSGNMECCALCKNFIVRRLREQGKNIPAIFDKQPIFPQEPDGVPLPQRFSRNLYFIKSNSLKAISSMLGICYKFLILGYPYLAGSLSEVVRNSLINHWNNRQNTSLAVPIECAARMLYNAMKMLNMDDSPFPLCEFKLVAKSFFNTPYRTFFKISEVFTLWLKNDKAKARRLLRHLEHYLCKRRRDSSNPNFVLCEQHLNEIGSIVDPEHFGGDAKPFSFWHKRHLLALAREYCKNGDLSTASDICERINIGASEFKNALCYPFLADFWALRADICFLEDKPAEQSEAIDRWLDYSNKAESFVENTKDSLRKLFKNCFTDLSVFMGDICSFC